MKKQGISLIVLVITIVVIIILAAAVILSLGQNNPINNSRVAAVSQTKDNVESGVLMYSSSIKAKTLGELSTKQILIDNDTYKIVDGATATITENSVEKTLNKIDITKAKEKLNVEIKEETNGAWYIDNNGKVYLIYNNAESIPSYLKENGEVVSTVSGFLTYAGSITNAPTTPNTPDAPTTPNTPVTPTPTGEKYLASDIAGMTDTQKQSVIGKSVSLTSTNGWNNWKVFSSDGTNIMLITGDYVEINSTNFPNGYSFTKVSGSDYKVNSNSRANLLSSLTNTTTFNGFKDSAGKVKIARIPTIEDFALSYNAVSHAGSTYNDNTPLIQKVYYKAGANNGYNVGPNANKTATSNDDVPSDSLYAAYMPQTETNYGNLWVISDNTKANGYWLASASASSTSNLLLCMHYNGYVFSNNYDNTDNSLRPVVVLASNVKLVQNVSGDTITYTLE